jgi:hypothetical protein
MEGIQMRRINRNLEESMSLIRMEDLALECLDAPNSGFLIRGVIGGLRARTRPDE